MFGCSKNRILESTWLGAAVSLHSYCVDPHVPHICVYPLRRELELSVPVEHS